MRGGLLRGVAVVILVVLATTGCATMEANPKTTIGAAGGGLVGGLIAAAAGGNPAAIAASVIGGMLVGGVVGNMLDQRDKQMAAEAAHRAMESAPTGRSVAWQNPDSGHSGTVTPTRTYQTGDGQLLPRCTRRPSSSTARTSGPPGPPAGSRTEAGEFVNS